MSGERASAAGDRRILTPEIEVAARACAEEFGVAAALHRDDYIFWFIHDLLFKGDERPAVREYFQSGQAGAVFLKALLDEHATRTVLADRGGRGGPPSFLEFASGYGRVTRHLPAILPDFAVTACDIHPQAVDALRGMGLDAVASTHRPRDFDLGRTFDVIYAFSFFTHMPKPTWAPWLEALGRHLSPGGLLIVTTHGRVSQRLMQVEALEEDGFFFHAVSEQQDLGAMEYGNTVTSFDYVYDQLAPCRLRLLQFRDAGAGQQDLYVLQRDEAASKPWSALRAGAEIDRLNAEMTDALNEERDRFNVESWRRDVELQRAKNAAAAELEGMRAQVEAMLSSHSWRLTAPLRGLARTLAQRG